MAMLNNRRLLAPLHSNILRTILPYSTQTVTGVKNIQHPLPSGPKQQTRERFREFDLQNKVFIVTGGGRGLGLAMAEALVEAGGEVHCLDRLPEPDDEFHLAQKRADPQYGGSLHYRRMDIRDTENVNQTMASIASQKQRLDGLIAAAGINHVESALRHTDDAVDEVLGINFKGVFKSATAAARQMHHWNCSGSILLVASMSGLVANKSMYSSAYNSSKAAVIQLSRCLAMEWGRPDSEGKKGIRVNALCPGHVLTSMVEDNISPEAQRLWKDENMLGRLARPEEFRGAALFLISDASSFMTGGALIQDGGHTAW